jgi:hypothetical protein
VLIRTWLGSSTEDGTGFTEGASYFEKPVLIFKKGTQPSGIENAVTSVYSTAVLLVPMFLKSKPHLDPEVA